MVFPTLCFSEKLNFLPSRAQRDSENSAAPLDPELDEKLETPIKI